MSEYSVHHRLFNAISFCVTHLWQSLCGHANLWVVVADETSNVPHEELAGWVPYRESYDGHVDLPTMPPEAFSSIITAAALVLPLGTSSMTDASPTQLRGKGT